MKAQLALKCGATAEPWSKPTVGSPSGFGIEKEWRWSGMHVRRRARDWRANLDVHAKEIEAVLRTVHDSDTALWMRRWRWFFLAALGLLGHADGSEWGSASTG